MKAIVQQSMQMATVDPIERPVLPLNENSGTSLLNLDAAEDSAVHPGP